jgi:hypothetical protein
MVSLSKYIVNSQVYQFKFLEKTLLAKPNLLGLIRRGIFVGGSK